MADETEITAMRRAIALAAHGLGTTSPNPVVGAVVLDGHGTVVGEGYHEFAGGSHAEAKALRQAGERARGGTLAVTLEPCHHEGRTAPCTREILLTGLRRVIIGTRDPHLVAAGGADALRTAGIDVEIGVCEVEAERVNEAWLTYIRLGRPFVTWKYAASLDGRVAAADGSSRWITGVEARNDVHRLRSQVDAIIVGSGTVRVDDPRLTVRMPHTSRQPLRVVVDTDANTPSTARVLDDSAPTLLAIAGDTDGTRLEGRAAVVRIPRAKRGLVLSDLLAELREREIVSVLLEGGPTLAASFRADDLVDRVIGYVAPVLIGGGGQAASSGPGAATINDVTRLRLDEVTRVGSDVRLIARRSREEI